MSELSKKYTELLNEIDQNITDEKQNQYVKNKISDLSIIFIDIIDRMSEMLDQRISKIEKSQINIENRLEGIQSLIDAIEEDVYDDNSDIEITCPYCNYDFIAEFNENENNEIECPECHNIVELDINADYDEDSGISQESGCPGCGSCGGCKSKKDNNEDN